VSEDELHDEDAIDARKKCWSTGQAKMPTMNPTHSFWRLALAVAVAFVLPQAPVIAQNVPHWNVTLPADPGTATQTVSLTSGTVTVDRKFSEGSFQVAVPLKSVVSITQPYVYKKNWLIDLHLSKKITATNKMNVGMVQTRDTDEVSILFLSKSDAADARTYLLNLIQR
jgi:hypothetical protein